MKQTRWQQRFENYTRAFHLLEKVFADKSIDQFSELEKEGIVQRFEYTFELAWKTLKDYLEYSGVTLEQITPRYVIKQAFASKIIQNGQVWINMFEHRNLMSHTYNPKTFTKAIEAIANHYLIPLKQLHTLLSEKDN